VPGGEHYLNQPLNRCARLMAAGHGGQALISGTTEPLVRDGMPDGCGLLDLGDIACGISPGRCVSFS